MTASLAPVTLPRYTPAPPSVDDLLAVALGVQPETAHQFLYNPSVGVIARAVTIARTLTLHGRRELRDRRFRALLDILTDAPAAKPVDAVLHTAAVADAQEDIEESNYRQKRDARSRDRYIEALELERFEIDELLRALKAEKAAEVA